MNPGVSHKLCVSTVGFDIKNYLRVIEQQRRTNNTRLNKKSGREIHGNFFFLHGEVINSIKRL